ncbi:MAG: NADPH-dependent FMN reductase [Acidimicrobiales bacterium]
MTSPDLRIAVLAGSTRPNRRALSVAEWICAEHLDGLELVLVDLDAMDLPMLAEPSPAAFGDYTLDRTRDWSRLIDGFDGYVLVSPEYNHSTTAPLKNALDHLYREWHDKAVGFVGYGVDGGVRAVEHLRVITAELGMAGVGPQVALNLFEDFDDQGLCAPRQRQCDAATRMLGDLARWAGALRPLRDDIAAGDATVTAVGEGDVRPRLHQQARTADAESVVAQLIERLQTGLDRGDADHYDATLAADVLWGAPTGRS